ncbi:MAG: (d)CMP kinase [Nitrospiraceae bacterium]|nr:(d)CMP kinase [Nitrospiraceae bacterium]
MGRVIAIDGPSGAGKSTIAKELAKRLGFRYLDTGALYRAVALAFREKGIRDNAADDLLSNLLSSIQISFIDGKVFLNGRDVSEDIRSPEIGRLSSIFSSKKVVRKFLLNIQRDAAKNADLVAEGRDMTTVVFPDAWKKFYLDASTDQRTNRRYLQLKEKGMDIEKAEAKKDVIERDIRDSSRDISPLKKADDAVYIDSSTMSADEVMNYILKITGVVI